MKRRHILTLLPSMLMLHTPALRAAGHNQYCEYRDTGGAFLRNERVLVAGANYRAHVVEVRRSGQPVTVLVEERAHYNSVLRDLRAGQYPSGSVAVFDFSPDPALALSGLDAKLTGVNLLHDIPATVEHAMTIHGRAYSEAEYVAALPALALLRQDLNRRGAIDLTTTRDRTVADRLQQILAADSGSNLFVLVAHRDLKRDGDPLRGHYALQFHDGSQFDLSSAGAGAALLWVVSCDTWPSISTAEQFNRAALVTTQPLSYAQGANAARLLQPATSVRDAIFRIQRAQRVPRIAPSAPSAPASAASHIRTPPAAPTFHYIVELNPGRVLSTSAYTAVA